MFDRSSIVRIPTFKNEVVLGGCGHTGLFGGYLYKNYAVRAGALGLLHSGDPPAADCAKPTISLELSVKPAFWASWRPRRPQDGPPGAQDSLPTGLLAPKTASRRASWRARRLPTSLLAPQTASDGPPGAQDGLRPPGAQDGLPDGPPGAQDGLRMASRH